MTTRYHVRSYRFMIFLTFISASSCEPAILREGTFLNATTNNSSEVCELNNSCTTPSVINVSSHANTTEKKTQDKWQYNVSGGTGETEITNTLHKVHESNSSDAVSFEIDVTKVTYNRSTSQNESRSMNTKYIIHPEVDCFCDITRGGCDLNCCCDRDCLFVNRNVFKLCNKTSSQAEDDPVCIAKVLDSPLLCIVKDNLYSRHFFPQYKISPEIAKVDKLLKNRKVFGWSMLPVELDAPADDDRIQLPTEAFKEYQFHSPLLTMHDHLGLRIFRLPRSTITSRSCDQREAVGFLENFNTVCTHRLSTDLVAECEHKESIFNANVYFKNISIVMNPALINSSFKMNCSEICINIIPFICETEDPSTCETSNMTTKTPFMSSETRNLCRQAVTSVHYNFLHNGTEGVLAVRVFLQLEDIPLRANSLWAIKFATSYAWFNQNDSYELSGYPGYVTGKPVIAGVKIPINSPNENRTRYAVNMSHHPEHWLTMFTANADGTCSKKRRRNVLFQYNMYAHCSLKVAKIDTVQQCELLQTKVLNVMFGSYINVSNVLLSSYGTPNVNEISSWISPVTNLKFAVDMVNETCSEVVTSIKLVILYSTVGDHDKPEQTIIASKLTGTTISRNFSRHSDKLRVSFALNFYDVTNPPLRIFAEPPTYEIKLPTDFFYPFFSTAASLKVAGYQIWLFLIIVTML